jgi:hypothetical protein
MMGLTLWALMGLYLWLFLLVGSKNKTWRGRFIWWGVMLIPLAYWLWDYPVIKYQHEQACKQDGGLRVLIQPEKSDRIQLDSGKPYESKNGSWYKNYKKYDESDARYLLEKFYPRLQIVEVREDNGPDRGKYFAYSVDPSSTGMGAKDYKYLKTPLLMPTPGLYVLTGETRKISSSRSKDQVSLIRNGQLYAKWTSYHAMWNSSGVLPHGWQCHLPKQTPNLYLVKLILK